MNIYLAGLIYGNARQVIDAANQVTALGHHAHISLITDATKDTIDLMREAHAIMKGCDAVIFLTHTHPSTHSEQAMALTLGGISIFYSIQAFLAHQDFLLGMQEADEMILNMESMPVEVTSGSFSMTQGMADVMASQHMPNWELSLPCPHCGGSVDIEWARS